MIRVAGFILFITLFGGRILGQAQDNNYKFRTAKGVYDELVNAFGDGRISPEFRFIAKKDMKDSIVAAFVPGDVPLIKLEELAYDVCTSFGKDSLNALSCILGHELAHWYLRHAWCYDFSTRLSYIRIAPDLMKISKDEQLKNETEADYLGFYFGNVAGYKTFDIAPYLLTKLYSTYKLAPNLKGYPTLEQRIEAARKSKVLVLRRLPVFDAGTYLYQIGEYEMAFACFNNLLSDFTSRENYNNAAVCKMQMALNLFQPYEMPFCFPFELDYESRIANGSSRSGIPTENGGKRKSYLSDAKKLLDESIRKDPNYSKAKINLAICYIMLNDTDMASAILKNIEPDSMIEKKVLNAICTAKKNNFTLALKELSEIIPDSGRYGLVANNKALFKLAAEKELNLGDDELGYQLENSESFIPNTSIVINKPENNALFECYNSTGRIINIINDSIRVSKDNEIFILKANPNYDNVLLIKNTTTDHSVLLCFISDSNTCSKPKPVNTIFLSAFANKVITAGGVAHKSVFAKEE